MSNITNKINISLPQIDQDNVIRSSTFVRSYREDGLRLEYQNINDKNIFHNYGQGGSEISLSYGCAYIITKTLTVKLDYTKITEVAVIGSGINALITALELAKRGYKVILYAKALPGEKDYPYQQNTFWYPGFYDNCDPLRHELISKLSFQFFSDSLKMRRYQSLSPLNLLAKGPKSEQIHQYVTEFINKDISHTFVNFGNERLEEYILMKTIQIDSNLFAQEILTQLKLRGVKIQQKQFISIEDVLSIKEKQIFNCLGFQCRKVFGDHNLIPIKNQFIEMKGQKNGKDLYCMWISSQQEGEDDIIINYSGDKYTIGVSSEKDISSTNVEEKVNQKILRKAYHYVRERKMKPYKL